MDPRFEQRWRSARALENAGDVAQAKAIYEILIREDPARLYVRLRLCVIERSESHYRKASEHARACAQSVCAGKRPKDLLVVTSLLLEFDERDLVAGLLEFADWTHPDTLRDIPGLSQQLWLLGLVDDAIERIDAARNSVVMNSALRFSRARALQYAGRVQEATDEFEQCLRLDPNNPDAHWALANHQKSNPPGSRIERIQRAKKVFAAEAPQQVYLDYALYKEFEDAGDATRAWECLAAGARLKRRQIHYQPAMERTGFEQLFAMTAGVLAPPDGQVGEAEPVPVFIVGMPRTGTTLLERIVGAHPDVASLGELMDFESALSWESDQFFATFVHPRVLAGLDGVDMPAVGARYLQRIRSRVGGKRWSLDKNPLNFIHAGFIASALPHAKILCLRRNPMDACFSNLRNLFTTSVFGYSYDLDELADYYLHFEHLAGHWRDTLGSSYMEVSYERLVTDPVRESERVMQFCGLSFDPSLADITRNVTPVTTASSSQVRQPINTKGIGAWRRYESQLQPLHAGLEHVLADGT